MSDFLTEADYVTTGEIRCGLAEILGDAADNEDLFQFVRKAYNTGLRHGFRSARGERGAVTHEETLE